MSNQNQTISWQAPEFRHYPKNLGWYITLIAVAVLIVGFFVIEKDLFAAATTALLAGFVIFFSRQKPTLVTIELSNKAIKFGNLSCPYKQLKYFWIVNSEHHKTLNFSTSTYVNNTIILELEDQDPDEIREFLLQHLPEHHETEATFAQKVSHKLKF
jgi:hypothetical protein